MPEDRSLDDFADADSADGESSESNSDGPEDDAAGPPDATDRSEATDAADAPDTTDPADADPATATSTWHADGAACDRCGDRVQRRWRDDDAFVCADCVSW